MKLATFNLNGIRARLPRLLEWLEREQPDVVCLQELKCADESLPIADIEAAGYGAVWHGQKGFNGVAILAKGDTPELRRVGLARRSRRHATAAISRPRSTGIDRRLALSAQRQSGRHREVRLQAALDGAAGRPCRASCSPRSGRRCCAGDWNVVPEDRDVFSVRATAARRGDAARDARRVAPDRPPGLDRRAARASTRTKSKLYTFWDYTAGCWQRDARLPHRPSAVLARGRRPAAGRRRRQMGAGRGESLRPRADVGRADVSDAATLQAACDPGSARATAPSRKSGSGG